MKLSEHFTLEEMTRSEYAIRKGIDNTPNAAIVYNLQGVCLGLEIIRKALGKSINVSSGYRSPEVNKGIGGAVTSQHTVGQAADINVSGMTAEELYLFIKELVDTGQLKVDQCIQEFNAWVHVSFTFTGERNEFLRANKVKGSDGIIRTVYTKD